jgi:hypothetical protein
LLTGQTVQALDCCEGAYDPGAHAVQTLRPVDGLKVPAGQAEGADEATGQKFPIVQFRHALSPCDGP